MCRSGCPIRRTDEYQKILKANVSAPYPTKIVKGAEYGNQIVHIRGEGSEGRVDPGDDDFYGATQRAPAQRLHAGIRDEKARRRLT